jgi:hypothetical protein
MLKRYSSRWKQAPYQGSMRIVDGNSHICDCLDTNFDKQIEHANLIAEAPELLHWLEAALSLIEGEFPADDYLAGPIMASMRDSIKNAKGET